MSMIRKFRSVLSVFALVFLAALPVWAMTPEEEDAAWRKEPALFSAKTVNLLP